MMAFEGLVKQTVWELVILLAMAALLLIAIFWWV